VRFGLFHRLEYLPFDARDLDDRPARPGLQSEPRDSHPPMYIGIDSPETLKPLYSIISSPAKFQQNFPAARLLQWARAAWRPSLRSSASAGNDHRKSAAEFRGCDWLPI
jgi:hypothetical protein